jgi:ketosteroid isomerase-like protein
MALQLRAVCEEEGMIYRRVVRSILTGAFEGLNRGDIQAVTGKFAPAAEHYFIGNHALSGTRRTSESIERWYARLLALFPDIRFQIHQIEVEGPPWRTLATVYWTETNTGTDGVRTQNEGVNVMEIRWGKVHRLRIYTDTARLTNTLDRLAQSGNPDAHASAIVDR